MSTTPLYHFMEVGNVNLSYTTAGDPELPPLLLLHSFPSSAAQWGAIQPMLSDQYHIIAPSLPGFGATTAGADYVYNFAALALTLSTFLQAINVTRLAIYCSGQGADLAFRLATGAIGTTTSNSTSGYNTTMTASNTTSPFDIAAIISQNGNIYKEAISSDYWGPLEQYWSSGSDADRETVRDTYLTINATENIYLAGVPDSKREIIAPAAWYLDYLKDLEPSSGRQDAQLDLLYDYRNNVALYPQFQAWLRQSQVPLLAVWGKGDPSLLPIGAESFKNDVPKAKVQLLDTGHFATATDATVITRYLKVFLTSLNY